MDAEIVADAGNVERQHLVEERRVGKARDHHPDEEGKGGEVEEMSRKERSGERRKEAERGQVYKSKRMTLAAAKHKI